MYAPRMPSTALRNSEWEKRKYPITAHTSLKVFKVKDELYFKYILSYAVIKKKYRATIKIWFEAWIVMLFFCYGGTELR